jgi:cell filamentation protein
LNHLKKELKSWKQLMNNNTKISIRFFDDREVRAVWGEENSKWLVFRFGYCRCSYRPRRLQQSAKLLGISQSQTEKENSELVSATTQLKLLANDGKRYLTDMFDYSGIIGLGK